MSKTGLLPRQWQVLEAILPPNPRVGRRFRDHHQVINGILWRIRNGTPWRCIPAEYGPWSTCYDRFRRWERDGTWDRIVQSLIDQHHDEIDWANVAQDSTFIPTHRSATGAPHTPAQADAEREVIDHEYLGRSRGGRTTKIHAIADQYARPLTVLLTPGQASDGANLMPTLSTLRVNKPGRGRPRTRPKRVIVDRAYGARSYREQLHRRGIGCVCPERKDAKRNRLAKGSKGGRPPAFDAEAYKGRNVIERCFNRLKDFRCVAMRYEKRGRSYRACVLVAMMVMWL